MRWVGWWRRRRDLSQRGLQHLSGVGHASICRIERGEVEHPRHATLKRLASALDVEVIDLVYGPRHRRARWCRSTGPPGDRKGQKSSGTKKSPRTEEGER